MSISNISELRRERLRHWFSGRTLPEAEKSYISQLMSGKASFGEKSARRLERDYGMGDRYLDRPPEAIGGQDSNPVSPVAERLIAIVHLLDKLDEFAGLLGAVDTILRSALPNIDFARGNPKTQALIDRYVNNAASLEKEAMATLARQLRARTGQKNKTGSTVYDAKQHRQKGSGK